MSVKTIEDYMNDTRCTPCEAIRRFTALDIPDYAFKTICAFFPQIVSYVEEDRCFSFKIALGEEEIKSPYGGCFPITRVHLDPSCGSDSIKRAIKDVVPFCNTFTNVFVRYLAEDNVIEVGVYTAEQDTFRHQEEFLLKRKYVVFSPVGDIGIIATKKGTNENEVMYLPLDLGLRGTAPKNADKPPVYYSKICRMWDGLLERAREEVHGTICLVVDGDYVFEDDCDRADDTKEEKEQKTFLSGTPVRVENVISSQNNMDLFLAMLNYDGITVVRTSGEIVAYHAKCKTNSERPVVGGMRHQARTYLEEAGKRNGHYVGLYFQSQEGKISFLEFKNVERGGEKIRELVEDSRFNCKIMMPDAIDSDFRDFLGQAVSDGAICVESSEWVDTYNEMTEMLLEFFNLSDTELDTLLSIIEAKISIPYPLAAWEKYFEGLYCLSEKLLDKLSDPFLSKHYVVLRECFESEAKEPDEYVLVALDCFLLRYNHLQFADMKNELKRRKGLAGWNNLLDALL